MILDLLPTLAAAYFKGRLPATLSYAQAAILLSMGLQRQELTDVEKTLGLPSNQVWRWRMCGGKYGDVWGGGYSGRS